MNRMRTILKEWNNWLCSKNARLMSWVIVPFCLKLVMKMAVALIASLKKGSVARRRNKKINRRQLANQMQVINATATLPQLKIKPEPCLKYHRPSNKSPKPPSWWLSKTNKNSDNFTCTSSRPRLRSSRQISGTIALPWTIGFTLTPNRLITRPWRTMSTTSKSRISTRLTLRKHLKRQRSTWWWVGRVLSIGGLERWPSKV